MITVQKIDDTHFAVRVTSQRTTTHTVVVPPAYYEKLTGGRVTMEVLIEKSFEFLLDRESNTSILSTFDLPVIARYFPEYESKIREILK